MRHQMPPDDAVRSALDRVLGSDTLARSERARALLRYLVEREQAGEADRLKGFSIALDVFGRDSGFDAGTDAVVRVQAGRLRDLLDQYYAHEGKDDPLRIEVPRGGYVPSYVVRTVPCAEGDAAPAAAPTILAEAPRPRGMQASVARHLQLYWAAIAVVIALLSFVAYQVAGNRAAQTEGALVADDMSTGTTGAMATGLPLVYLSVVGDDEPVARIERTFRSALTGFDTVELISSDPKPGTGTANAAFMFELSRGGEGEAAVELRNIGNGQVLMARNVALENAEDSVAGMLSSVAPVSGTIYAYVTANGLETPLTRCLLLNDGYYRNPSAEAHRETYECFEALAAAGSKSPLVYSELGALQLRAITNGHDYPADASREAALELARRGIQFGPHSPYAHRAYGFLMQRFGEEQEAIRWMKQAYELNTFDLSMAAAYAYAQIFAGDYEAGTPVMERAVLVSSAHPGWWDYALFLGRFMLDDMEGAARALTALETTKRGHYYLARLIAADHDGDLERAEQFIAMIVDEYPKLAADPRAFYQGANYPGDMTDRLVEAIAAAGLTSGS